jgi:hypothetical protein
VTLPATKLVLVVERLLQPTVERLLTEARVTGWSVFPGGGHGSHGTHRTEAAQVVHEFALIKIEAIVRDRATAETIAERFVADHLGEQPGIIWLEQVEVLQATKF